MKHRQPRIATLINARLNSDAGWTDVVIRNMSASGAMLQLPTPPRRGTYVELRRGTSVIVARTIWSEGQRCGIQAQDRIALEGWLSGPVSAAAEALGMEDRRRIRRAAPVHHPFDPRSISMMGQTLAVVTCIALLAGLALVKLYQNLALVSDTVVSSL